MNHPPRQAQEKLNHQENIWLASVRSDGRPHLVPVWFAWHDGKLFLCIDPESVKAKNILQNPNLALALEDGSHPVICEGMAAIVPDPWPEAVSGIFHRKYGWMITSEYRYTMLVEVTPVKWLTW